MLTKIHCQFSGCEQWASMQCRCSVPGFLVCDLHMGPHSRSPSDHDHAFTNAYYDSSPEEAILFDDLQASLEESYSNCLSGYKAEYNEELRKAEEEYQKKLRAITKRQKQKEDKLLRNYHSLKQEYEILNRVHAVPVFSDSPFLSKLASLKQQSPHLQKADAVQILREILISSPDPFSIGISGGLKVHRKDEEDLFIRNPDLQTTSQYMCLDSNTVLATGGGKRSETGKFVPHNANQAFLINITTGTITRLPDLTVGRVFHAMTWVDGKPAAIGGVIDEEFNKTETVEVLNCGRWEAAASLVVPSGHLSACCDSVCSYIVGGVLREFYLSDIERYYMGKWELLTAALPINIVQPGIFCRHEKLYVLGGIISYDAETKKANKTKSVFKIDLRTLASKQLKDLDFECSFLHNNWVISDREAIAYGLTSQPKTELIKFKF